LGLLIFIFCQNKSCKNLFGKPERSRASAFGLGPEVQGLSGMDLFLFCFYFLWIFANYFYGFWDFCSKGPEPGEFGSSLSRAGIILAACGTPGRLTFDPIHLDMFVLRWYSGITTSSVGHFRILYAC